MWEAIAANRRRSIVLIGLMGIVLATLGSCIGMYVGSQVEGPGQPEALLRAGLIGAAVAIAIWLALWVTAVFGGDRVLLRSAHANEIRKHSYPQLWNIVEEMTIASGLAKMPRVYVIEDDAPNAFAVGRKPDKAAVAVTSGLLRLLNRDELQGVVAHEIGHIRNLDIRFMTIAAVLVASVELISEGFLRGAARGGARRSRRSSKGSGVALLVLVLVVAILAPILARLLYLACSRHREYLADASAARFTRFPDGLASALEKIAVNNQSAPPQKVSGALAALYIINPIASLSSLFSTHPPTDTRIRVLRSMGGRAGYVDYEAALRKLEGRKLRLAALEKAAQRDESVVARPPTMEVGKRGEAVERAQAVNDLLDRFANYLILGCSCGVRIKVPPDFSRAEVPCSRCARMHAIPQAKPLAGDRADARQEPAPTGDGTLHYERQNEPWNGFRCPCGQTIQIGPDFPLDYTICISCSRRIELDRQPVA